MRRFYVPQLDGLRFFAFLLVFAHHLYLMHFVDEKGFAVGPPWNRLTNLLF